MADDSSRCEEDGGGCCCSDPSAAPRPCFVLISCSDIWWLVGKSASISPGHASTVLIQRQQKFCAVDRCPASAAFSLEVKMRMLWSMTSVRKSVKFWPFFVVGLLLYKTAHTTHNTCFVGCWVGPCTSRSLSLLVLSLRG